MTVIIALIFVVAALTAAPIAFAAGVAGSLYLVLWDGVAPGTIVRIMYYSLDSFPLLAIPLFMMMGRFAEKAGLLDDLVAWLVLVVGRMRAGMAYINVLGSMLFAGISGAAASDVASLGPIEMKMMRSCGYPDRFSACLTASSAILGPIIPPSIGMIIYALAAGRVSTGGLFLAGVIPGILMGGGLLILSYFYTRHMDVKAAREKMPPALYFRRFARKTIDTVHFLVLPLFIIGAIVGGVCTVTETAAIGAVYTLLLGFLVTRTLTVKDVMNSIVWAGVLSSVVALLIASGSVIGWILTRNRVTAHLAEYLISISSDPLFFMVAVAAGLIVVGMFIDVMVAIIALAPLLAPVAESYGISSLQFGMVFILTIEIGLITPPIGNILFMTSVISGVKVEHLYVDILPFVAVEMAVVPLIILWPDVTLWIPGLFGFR